MIARSNASGSSVEPSPTRKADEVGRFKSRDELRQENELPRDRVSRLTTAILRISESVDLGTVLREVVDGARAVTGARFGGVVTLGESEQILEFVTSGITDAEHQRVAEWPEGLRLYEHFRDLPGPLLPMTGRA